MLWAACCLCFFGFLRSGEAVAPTVKDYDPRCHLSFDDMCVDNRANPSFLRVRIKASKTDPFRQGVDIYVGRAENELCPVKAVLAYGIKQLQAGPPLSVGGWQVPDKRGIRGSHEAGIGRGRAGFDELCRP